MRRLAALGLLLVATCLLATPTFAASGPYDGSWSGSGTTADGKLVSLTFTVANSALTGVVYRFTGTNGLECTDSTHDGLPPAAQAPIANNAFAFHDDSLAITATLSSPTDAAGELDATWAARYTTCNGRYRLHWTATRQAAAAAPAGPVTVSWCGLNVNCRDLLLQLLAFGLTNGAVLALNAIAVTVIYSTVRILNLAHGDMFALTTALVTTTLNFIGVQANWPPLLLAAALAGMLVLAVGFGVLLSAGIEWAAFRPFRGRSRLAPLIATLGLSFILYQVGLVWRTFQASYIPGEHRSVPGLPEVPTDRIPDLLPNVNLVQALGLNWHVVFHVSDLFVLAVAALFVVVTALFLNHSATGRAIRAAAQNPELAQILGIDLNATIRRAFMLGGGLAGAAAFTFALYYSRPFGAQGAESGLLAFSAALLGGIGSPLGALAAGLTLGVVGSFSDYFLSPEWTSFLLLALLVGLLVLRPTGLAAEAGPSEAAASGSLRDSVILTAPGQSNRRQNWLLIFFAAIVIFPVLALAFGWSGEVLLSSAGIFILLTLGLNLALGLAGVLDLGYAISFGAGAYATAILTNRAGPVGAALPQPLDYTLVLGASVGLAALVGALKGGLAARLRGDYLAVATLALGLMGQRIIVNWQAVTGGAGGTGALPPPSIFTLLLAGPTAQYYLVFGFVALAAAASLRVIQSRTGRAWRAGSDDETAAESSGVNVGRYNLLAFVLSSALAGLAGSLYATTFAYVDPNLLAFNISTLTLTMVILGGAGSVPGAFLGALAIIAYDKVLVPQAAALLAVFWPAGHNIGMVPDIRGTAFFNFGVALYLTVLLRARWAGRARLRQRLASLPWPFRPRAEPT